jgi:hypothetical protein
MLASTRRDRGCGMKKKIEIFIIVTAFCALFAYFLGQISSQQHLENNQYTGLKAQLWQAGNEASEAQKLMNDLIEKAEQNEITEKEATLLRALRKKGVDMDKRDFFYEVDELSKAMLHECPYHGNICKKKETILIAQAIIKTAKKRKESIARTVHHKVSGARYFLSYHSQIPPDRQKETEKKHGTEYFELALKILSANYNEDAVPTHWCNASVSTCDWHKNEAKDKKKLLGYIDYANNEWVRATRLETTKAFSDRYSKHFFIKEW